MRVCKLLVWQASAQGSIEPPSHYAYLLSGSSGFANYRHQADLCFQYHLLVDVGGIPANNVTTMMYNDAAWDEQNPFIGRLFNEPNGRNMYKKCAVDYDLEEVGVDQVKRVFQGIAGLNVSNVFVSYVDHGQVGSLLLPNGELLDQPIVENLLSLISPSNTALVMYVEACNGGSVFENMDESKLKNKIIITASAGDEVSWATYCPTFRHPWADMVHGVHVGTCLGDLFSVAWTRDLYYRLTDEAVKGDNTKVTLGEHIQSVRMFVAPKSTVSVFGDKSLLQLSLWDVFPKRGADLDNFEILPFNSESKSSGTVLSKEILHATSRVSCPVRSPENKLLTMSVP